MQRQFKIKPEISDVKVSVESRSLESLFRNSLLGMDEVLRKGFDKTIDGNLIASDIEVSAFDSTSLLITFLSEVLTLSRNTKIIFCFAQFMALNEKYLLATISGTRVDKFDKDIKGVSFHKAEIVKNVNGNYKTNIIFDYK